MGDEIKNANVIRIVKDGNSWICWIGPDFATGISATARTPAAAVYALADRISWDGWVFDPSWRPREIGYHDA